MPTPRKNRATSRSRAWSALRWGLAALLVPPLLYLLAALAGAFIPRNAGWQEPSEGVELFVRSNGVHADLVLPAQAAGIDWYVLVPPEHVRDPSAAGGWVGVGWGQREFYLETAYLADLTVGNALRALLGGATLIHVSHLQRPYPSRFLRPLRLPPADYRRMARVIADDFARDASGAALPLRGEGYGVYDTFYEARGTYHAFRTSNQWTADVLAHAGVEVGVWTPFEQGLMWRFQESGE